MAGSRSSSGSQANTLGKPFPGAQSQLISPPMKVPIVQENLDLHPHLGSLKMTPTLIAPLPLYPGPTQFPQQGPLQSHSGIFPLWAMPVGKHGPNIVHLL
jgi:hypothetical protein